MHVEWFNPMGEHNNSFNPTGISVPFIVNLSVSQLSSGGLIRALGGSLVDKAMRYFRYQWDETRGDKFDYWGRSTHWYEVTDDGYAARQMEVYEHGVILKYDLSHLKDEYGFLADQLLEPEKNGVPEVTVAEFEEQWGRQMHSTNAPPNNSFNATGMSEPLIESLDGRAVDSRRVMLGVSEHSKETS